LLIILHITLSILQKKKFVLKENSRIVYKPLILSRVPQSEVTIAELAQTKGYNTGLIGKYNSNYSALYMIIHLIVNIKRLEGPSRMCSYGSHQMKYTSNFNVVYCSQTLLNYLVFQSFDIEHN
jgi:hypothetical protein